MSKHSPLPWAISHGGMSGDDGFSIVTNNASAEHVKMVAECWPCTITCNEHRQELAANAEFIVKACNNHDALLAACKTLLAICRWKCSPLDDVVLTDGRTNEQAMMEAMEVIQAAESKQEANLYFDDIA